MKNLSSSDFDVDGQPMRLNTQHQSSTRDIGGNRSLSSHPSPETQPQTQNKTESPAPSQERPTKEEGSNTVKNGRGHGPRRHTDWKK